MRAPRIEPRLGFRTLAGAVTAMLVLALSVGVGPASASRIRPEGPASPGSGREGVSAVLVDSFGFCDITDAWATLNADWSQYGSVALSVTTGGSLCSGHFTLADLEASDADTIVVSDSAWWYRWTPVEVNALQQYLEQGHNLVGLGVDFQWHRHDNGALAPLFGLTDQLPWRMSAPGGHGTEPTYTLQPKNPAAPVLFRGVANPYISSPAGNDVQEPADTKWSHNDLAGATIAGLSGQRRATITVYNGPGYDAIYIASAAWYQSTADDLQFLYNALIYPNQG